MSKSSFYILVALIGATVLFTAAFFFLNNSSKKGTSTTEKGEKTIVSPLDYTNRKITAAVLSYTFNAKITKIDVYQNYSKIETDSTIPDLPELRVLQRTRVNIQSKNRSILANRQQLKEGQNVRININYGMRNKQWSIRFIDIIDPNFSPPAPTISAPTASPSSR